MLVEMVEAVALLDYTERETHSTSTHCRVDVTLLVHSERECSLQEPRGAQQSMEESRSATSNTVCTPVAPGQADPLG